MRLRRQTGRAGHQRSQHDFKILEEGLGRLHRRMHGFGPADGHLDAAGEAAGGHVFGKAQPLLAADPFDRRDQLLAIETGMFLIEIAGLDQMLGEQLLDMRRAVERCDELPEPRGNFGYQDIGETASGLVGGVCRRDFRGERVLMQLFDDGAEQRFLGFEMVVERLSGQAGRLRGLLDRRAPKPWRRNTAIAASRMRVRALI